MSEMEPLDLLCQRLGVQRTYRDGRGQDVESPIESIFALFRALGVHVSRMKDVARAITEAPELSPADFAKSSTSAKVSSPLRGAFLPLYALRSSRSIGTGDLSDLGALATKTQEAGYDFLGTLPLFATFLGDRGNDYAPSPYQPVSRRFWNELYLDPRKTPEWETCPEAKQLLTENEEAFSLLSHAHYADVREIATRRRPLLEALAACWEEPPCAPTLEAYARFRAKRETSEKSGGAFERAARYHRYVQTQLRAQLTQLSKAHSLYLDLPIGLRRDGFDVFERPDAFLDKFSLGAPPDAMFPSGQCWGITVPNPRSDDSPKVLEEAVATLAEHARILRLDHVMGLHRTFCVPDGAKASEGVYLRQPAAENYAAIQRGIGGRTCVIVGEDLGTVQPVVREQMKQAGMLGMRVVQIGHELADEEPALVCLNTHDMPTYEGFCQGVDLKDHAALGWLEKDALPARLKSRQRVASELGTYADARTSLLRKRAALTVINLEDEWGEVEPQNTPGTSDELKNFCRRATRALEEIELAPPSFHAEGVQDE